MVFETPDRVVDSVIVRDAVGLIAHLVVGADVDKPAFRQQEIAQDFANRLNISLPDSAFPKGYQPALINYQAARSPLDIGEK